MSFSKRLVLFATLAVGAVLVGVSIWGPSIVVKRSAGYARARSAAGIVLIGAGIAGAIIIRQRERSTRKAATAA